MDLGLTAIALASALAFARMLRLLREGGRMSRGEAA
jgi:hypothetical protein